jgi:hypothetical protein
MKTRWLLLVALLLAMLLPGASLAQGNVYPLSPSGGDDTAAIQAAFSAAAANPGSTIQFAEGDYYLSDPIVANNLSGTVRGAGKDKTVIRLTPGVEFGVTPNPAWPGLSAAVIFLLTYDKDGAELTWEGMGWDIEGQAETWLHIWFGAWVKGMWPVWLQGVGTAPKVNTTWRDIRMQGREFPTDEFKVNLYSHIFQTMSGTHVIQDCHYDTMDYGPAFFSSSGANVTIGGNRSQDRVTIRNVTHGVLEWFGSGSRFEITNLRVWRENTPRTNAGAAVAVQAYSGEQMHVTGLDADNISGVWAFNRPEETPDPSTFLIEHSDIVMDPTLDYAGIEIHDPTVIKSQFVITNNRIAADNPMWPPIFLRGTRNAVVANNTLVGSGMVGMWLGAFWADDSGMVVKGNNLNGWSTAEGGIAPIWLTSPVGGNTIVGGGRLSTLVLDDTDDPDTPAYDGLNVLTGVNSAGGVVGEAVRAAMRARGEVRGMFR